MRRRTQHNDDQAEVNMTPMLDIVFILLIFFIVTATFLSEEGIDMRPPPPSDDTNSEPNPVILVQVDDENTIFVNQIRTDVDRVLPGVNRFRAEAPDSAVLLEVQDEADHGIIVQIWDEMKANGVPVSLQRNPGDGA
jgi:biopolymer transport protein ExbD